MMLWSSKDSVKKTLNCGNFLCDFAKKIRYDRDHACKKKYCYVNCKLTKVRLQNRSDGQEKKEKR